MLEDVAPSFGVGVTIRVPQEQTRLRTGMPTLIIRPQLGQQWYVPAERVTAASFMGSLDGAGPSYPRAVAPA